ncbi:MAG: DUF4399 domain-containing protein [Gammaproteobacteria bacterium]
MNTIHATPAPKDAKVYIISPSPGEIVTSPVTVRFGLVNMGVAPAGVDKKNTGHHHLLVDVKNLPAMDKPVPSDKQHIHFGGGQTQVVLELPKGKHTVQLLLGDKNHVPHTPPVMSEKVTFTVQ